MCKGDGGCVRVREFFLLKHTNLILLGRRHQAVRRTVLPGPGFNFLITVNEAARGKWKKACHGTAPVKEMARLSYSFFDTLA